MLNAILKSLLCRGMVLTALAIGFAHPAQAAFPTGEVAQALSWLPGDIENLTYASGPLTINIPKKLKKGETAPPPVQNLKVSSQFYVSNLWIRVAEKRLDGHTIKFSLEGKRKFQRPKNIGVEKYEGCGILKLEPEPGLTQAQLSEELKAQSKKRFVLKGVPVALISGSETRNNRENWDIYLAAPTADTVLIATDQGVLEHVITQITASATAPASPLQWLNPRWKGWSYVDTTSRLWMARSDVSHAAENQEPNDIVGYEDEANECIIITGMMSDRTELLNATGNIRTETNLRLTTKEVQRGMYEIRCWLNGDEEELGTLSFYLTKIFGPAVIVAPF